LEGYDGPRGTVDEKTRHIAAAAAWGLNPEKDATHLNYRGPSDDTVGRLQGDLQSAQEQRFLVDRRVRRRWLHEEREQHSQQLKREARRRWRFIACYGSKELCGDVSNRLDATPGWNFLMRVYRPGPSVLDGSYKLPPVEAAK
jgi:hypothetical protein